MNKLKAFGAAVLLALNGGLGMGGGALNPMPQNGERLDATKTTQLSKEQQEQKTRLAAPGFAHALRRLMGSNKPFKHSYPNGPGWTQAQVKRMARKKKNQAKNKRNHRG